MVGKTKSPTAAEEFSVAEWISLNEAFARLKAVLKSRNLAEHDLHKHMRSERSDRLPSAVRRLARDGSENFERLEPSFWKGFSLMESSIHPGSVQVRALGAEMPNPYYKWWFFVARREFDKLYLVQADEDATKSTARRRKPRPPPTHDWPLVVPPS